MAYVCVINNKKNLGIKSIAYTPNKCAVHQHKANAQYLECFRFTAQVQAIWPALQKLDSLDTSYQTWMLAMQLEQAFYQNW